MYHNKGLQLKSDFRDQIWQVVRGFQKNAHGFTGHKLMKGDIVKLGRLALTVREICLSGERIIPIKNSLENTEVDLEFDRRSPRHSRVSRNDGNNFILRRTTSDHERPCEVETFEKQSPQETKLCRICLSEEGTTEDPFISPCSCAGTMKFIHLNCLREWLASKRMER